MKRRLVRSLPFAVLFGSTAVSSAHAQPRFVLMTNGIVAPTSFSMPATSDTIGRINIFLDQLTAELPSLTRRLHDSPGGMEVTDPTATALGPFAYQATPLGGLFAKSKAVLPPLQRLDSLRMLWRSVSPRGRSEWMLAERGVDVVATALMELSHYEEFRRSSQRFADATLDAAVLVRRNDVPPDSVERPFIPKYMAEDLASGRTYVVPPERSAIISKLTAASNALAGSLSLAQGDTAAATMAFLRATQIATSPEARPAALALARIAAARHDVVQQVVALTFAYLETTGDNLAGKLAVYAELETAYAQAMAMHASVPDIVPNAVESRPVNAPPLDLDAYLDRQFIALYDRPFVVHSYVRTASSRAQRIAVTEYATGLFCSGCWHEDRMSNALMRRYPPGQLIALGYHGENHMPIGNVADSLWDRFVAWYPDPWSNRYREGSSSVIPLRTLLVGAKDTLNGGYWVDGHALPRYPNHLTLHQEWEFVYQKAAAQIDADLTSGPAAVVQLDTRVRGGSVAVNVHVDSIQGHHPRLALRLVLFEDTVRVRGGTIRRIYVNVVRAFAHTTGFPLGLPLEDSSFPSTIHYTFDVAAVQRQLLAQRDPRVALEYLGDSLEKADPVVSAAHSYAPKVDLFPDAQDWQMNLDRLHVVAFVQDVETGEILQAAQVKLPAMHL